MIEKFDEIEKLDEAIDGALTQLQNHQETSPEFAKIADQLTKLIKIKEILTNLSLKVYDAHQSEHEFNTKNAMEGRQFDLKLKEQHLKADELAARRTEVEDTYTLRKRELELKEEESRKPDRITKDTLAVIAANIGGIAMIIGYERANIIASKALGFIMRSR